MVAVVRGVRLAMAADDGRRRTSCAEGRAVRGVKGLRGVVFVGRDASPMARALRGVVGRADRDAVVAAEDGLADRGLASPARAW